MLSASQAQDLHGDDCWNPNVCYSRRSYARHRDRRNLVRARKHGDSDESLVMNIDEFASVYWAVLVVYRQAGTDTPIHCAGMVASQVHTYVQKILVLLESIRKNGKRGDKQNHICADCGRQFIDNYSVLEYSINLLIHYLKYKSFPTFA